MRLLALVFGLSVVLVAQPPMRLTLAGAERIAAQNNPQFSSARFTAAAAHQVPNQFGAAFQPNAFGSLTGVGADNGSRLAAGGLNNPVVYDRVGSGLTVTQMITDFGRTSNLVNSARFHAEAQDQFAETTRAAILLSTGTSYFQVLKAQSLLKVAEETVRARQLVVDQVTALAEAQQRSTLDVSFAKVNLSSAKLQLVQAQNDLKSSEAQLATAMGLPGATGFDLSDEPLPPQLPDRVQELLDTAIQNRPELKDLHLQVNAAERLAKAEHAAYYPSVGVLATAGFAPAAEAAVSSRYGAIGLNITIPVFNGGLVKSRQAEAELKAKAASENVTDLENRIARDVRIAYLNATAAYDRMALTRQLMQQALDAQDLAQSRYDIGLASMVELNQAQLNVTAAQIADTSARFDYHALRLSLDFQIGTLK